MLGFAYAAFWLAFFCLALSGVGLVLAVLFAFQGLPEPLTADVDAQGVQRGRWRAVRRYATWWLVSAAIWLAAGQVLRLAMGT